MDVNSNGVDEIALDASYNPDDPFNDKPYDEQFWRDVAQVREASTKKIDKLTAQRIVRVKRLREACGDDVDVLIDLIKTKHDNYQAWCHKNKQTDLFPTFVFMLTKLAKLILEEDFEAEEPKYLLELHEVPGPRIPEDDEDAMYMILHIAAERNLTGIMEIILNKRPGLSNVETYPDNR